MSMESRTRQAPIQWMATAAMGCCMSQLQELAPRHETNTWTKSDQGTPVRKIHLHTQLKWAQQLQQGSSGQLSSVIAQTTKFCILGQP